MHKIVKLADYEFEYHPALECFADKERVAFISRGYDEIHLIVELQDGQVVFHPRWNVKIATSKGSSKRYIIEVNFLDELTNYDDILED